MAEAPWIVDAWVNLLRPVSEAQRAAGENVFGLYGRIDALRDGTNPETLVAEMDAAGIDIG